MIDTKKIDINCLYNGFIKLSERYETKIYKICEADLLYADKQIILKSIELRRLVNEVREVNKIEKFQRMNESEIEIKGITGEYMFSKILHQISKNKYTEFIKIKTPPIAEMVLNKTVQDFVLINTKEDKNLTFDVKTQFKNNRYNYLCVNEQSFKRLKEQSKFFILALIDGYQDEFNSNNKVIFYYVQNSWFEENSELIKQHHSYINKFTPYYRLSLNIFNE